MASLLDTYEQQYAILTADITAKIGKISLLIGGERKNVISDVERQVEEAQELLEQMELEVREADASARPKLRTRLESYRAELKRLSQEFSKARTPSYQDSFGEDGSIFGESTGGLQEEQHQRLLDNSERIERTGRQLSAGYRIALETEEIGTEVLRDLHTQRETIQRTRSRLRETDAELGRSSRILNTMIARSIQHRVVLFVVAVALCGTAIFGIYLATSR
ncbi:hypothetical protein B566_EDAN008026 [Ephemera danica]|nr:hypothetical protein B566_EDAN008026 [Ephemera danica]